MSNEASSAEEAVTEDVKAAGFFVKMPVAVLMDKRLNAAERELYMWLLHMNRAFRGKLYPGQDYLVKLTGLTRTSIQNQLRKLRSVGLITSVRRDFADNNTYDIIPIDKVYSVDQLEATRKLPKKETIAPPARLKSRKSLDKWWNSLDPIRASAGRNLVNTRNKLFGFDSREIRKLQQFLYTATAWFTPEEITKPNDGSVYGLQWVAERPIDIVVKPNDCLTIDNSERAILALAPGLQVFRNGAAYKFDEPGLVVVSGAGDMLILPIQSALERLASI